MKLLKNYQNINVESTVIICDFLTLNSGFLYSCFGEFDSDGNRICRW